ncbi:hypothetical protein B7931_03715 [Streptococcus agalactiae]|nr:hypothetical protein [Streptococcus agalactiae]OTG52724.1 hypothetical protein B7931_03715 [Streptococcus agalactiae]
MEKITYYQPSLESLKRELDNYNKFINKDHVLFKFLVTYLAASVTENIEIPLPKMFRKFKRESLQRNGEKLIGQILDELHYLDNFDISSTFTLKNSGIKQLINLINNELDRKIKNELALYRKENLLLNLTLLASVLSKITMFLNKDYVESNDAIDELIKCLNSVLQYNIYYIFDPRVFLGELKVTLEHVLNRLLLTDEKEAAQDSGSLEIDCTGLFNLFELFYAKILLDSYTDFLPFINTNERDKISFSKENGISFPSNVLEKFSKYIFDTRDEEVTVGDKKIEVIMEYLQKIKNISPDILYNYLSQPDDKRAVKLNNNYLSVCEKNLIIQDFSCNQSLPIDNTKLIIENLTLNNENFYKSQPTGSVIGEPNMRLFRAPILEFSKIDILPTYSFFESAKYFPYRILRTDILNKRNGKAWTKLIQENFDERLLPELKAIAETYDSECKVNYYLNQSAITEIKTLVKKHSLMEEVDLVFRHDNTLFIYDLKNYGLARNVKQCRSIVDSKIYGEFAKLNKLKCNILSEKLLFEREFGYFKDIKVGVITVNTTPYKYFRDGRVYSIPELRKNPNLILK